MTPEVRTPKVSVVVPVYNPGSQIDDCIASILGQSLAAGDLEAIFVDDGSTDGTGERLDRLAAEHRHVTVIHIENSGWPGRPRNVGMDAARGAYVYFMDNDDRLGQEALERLHATAVRTGADVVVGKVVGHRRGVPRELFRRNRDGLTLRSDAMLLALLTPHKLFRAELLRRNAIRFPEGRVRLEDHLFVVPAYFAARAVSVVSDYPCYHWIRREDGGNASSRPPDHRYWESLARVLDIVEEHTEPGPLRDRLLVHWYRGKMLRRLGGAPFLSSREDDRAELCAALRDLAEQRFGPGVVERLEPSLRIRDRLLRAGRLEALTALAHAERAIGAETTLHSATWEDGVLCLGIRATLVDGEGPLRFPREAGRISWPLPAAVRDLPEVGLDDRDVTAALGGTLRACLRERESRVEFLVPVAFETETEAVAGGEAVTVTWHGRIRLDPLRAAVGRPLARGVWDLVALVDCCGVTAARRVAAGSTPIPPPAVLGDPPRAAIPYATSAGNVSIDVDEAGRALATVAPPALRDADVSAGAGSVVVGLTLPDVVVGADAGTAAGHLVLTCLTGGRRQVACPAALGARSGGARLESRIPFGDGEGSVGPGRWELAVRLGPRLGTLPLALEVPRHGRPQLLRASRAGRAAGRRPRVKRALLRIPAVRGLASAARRRRGR